MAGEGSWLPLAPHGQGQPSGMLDPTPLPFKVLSLFQAFASISQILSGCSVLSLSLGQGWGPTKMGSRAQGSAGLGPELLDQTIFNGIIPTGFPGWYLQSSHWLPKDHMPFRDAILR